MDMIKRCIPGGPEHCNNEYLLENLQEQISQLQNELERVYVAVVGIHSSPPMEYTADVIIEAVTKRTDHNRSKG